MTRVLPHIRRPHVPAVVVSALLLIFCTAPCYAEKAATAEWNITADKITRFENPENIIAEGNIVLEKREKVVPPSPASQLEAASLWAEMLEEDVAVQEITPDDLPQDETPTYQTKVTIRSDWMSYDVAKQSIRARGNVSIETPDDQLYADEAEVDLSKELGSLETAKIIRKDHDLHLEGRKIEKTGIKTYHIEDGWVITCKIEEGEVPPWSFSSSEATINQGGYAILKNAKFNIKDVPVFYLPYMVVPVKDTRQTGFLFPEITNSSRDGFGFNFPFFINISDSFDMTIYPEYYSERGFMPGAEFRYVLDENSKARFNGNYLDDELSDPSQKEYYNDTGFTHTNSDRYWFRGKLDHDFSDSLIARLDLDIVSDRDYLTEFNSGITGFSESKYSYLTTFGRSFENQSDDQRQNSMRLLKTWNGSSLNLDFLAINDVREIEEDEENPTSSPLWKLPSLEYAGALPIADTLFTFDWDADYVNYWREDGVGGHRLDLFPKISSPVPLGPYLESRAEVGLRGTMYQVETYGDGVWNTDERPNRILGTFHTDLATTLVRDFNKQAEDYSSLRHSIRPYIEYDYITDDDQDDLPHFDSTDLIEETNAFTYGVDTFFDLYDDEDNFFHQYGYLRVEQSYDIRSEASDERFSSIALKVGWSPFKRLELIYKAELPIEDNDNTVHGFESNYINSRGDSFSLDYRYNDDSNIEQINGAFKARLLPVLQAEFEIEHSISQSETNKGILALTYLQQCWSVQLKGQYTPTDNRIMLVFNLANIGTPLGVSF